MTEPDVFVNQDTGETLTLAGYVAQQRQLEREILRLDGAIDTLKNSLKSAKGDRDKAIHDLRSTVREIKILGTETGKPKRRARGSTQRPRRVETSPR